MNKVFNGRPILEGQPNFRSLDGIPAAGGRKIRKNMIYRSGNLSNLSASDILLLENAGLALVIDFHRLIGSNNRLGRHRRPGFVGVVSVDGHIVDDQRA